MTIIPEYPFGFQNGRVKTRLLNAALFLLLKLDYNGTSVHRITRQAKLKGSSLYHYFPSKEALVTALLSEIIVYCEENIFRYINSQPRNEQRFVKAFQNFHTKKPMAILACLLSANATLYGKNVYEKLKEYEHLWVKHITKYLQTMGYPKHKASKMANHSLILINGAITHDRIFQTEKEKTHLKAICDLLPNLWENKVLFLE